MAPFNGYFVVFFMLCLSMFWSYSNAHKQCFWPDGTVHEIGTPCHPDEKSSHCCENTHTCMTNGLCWDTTYNHILRVSCTDREWSAGSYCVNWCGGPPSNFSYQSIELRQCANDNTKWICGEDSANCTNPISPLHASYVDDRRGPSLNNIKAPTVDGGSNTPSSRGTGGAKSEDDVNKARRNIGLGVGLGIGIPLLGTTLASLYFLFRARREIAFLQGAQHGAAYNKHGQGGAQVPSRHHASRREVPEMDGQSHDRVYEKAAEGPE